MNSREIGNYIVTAEKHEYHVSFVITEVDLGGQLWNLFVNLNQQLHKKSYKIQLQQHLAIALSSE
jgi:hypothetical protein